MLHPHADSKGKHDPSENTGGMTALLGLPPTHGDKVSRNCPDRGTGNFPIHVFDESTSSMDDAWRLIDEGTLPVWGSVMVRRQRQGRGQFGRPWISSGVNLHASLRIPDTTQKWQGLTSLIIATAIHDALAGLGLETELKWPNDILHLRRKIGGILIEERNGTRVAGIGLNLVSAPPVEVLNGSSALPAGCLRDFGLEIPPETVWNRILKELVRTLSDGVSEDRLHRFITYFERHMAFHGEQVVFDATGIGEIPAIVLGIATDGGIRLRTADGKRTYHTGSLFPTAC